jgi:16S rRNA (guanine966-N2)-methyltransferase
MKQVRSPGPRPGPGKAGAGSNTVRIIGGDWRRRLLRFPDGEGLRPTPDRVRETLFNWLGQDLEGQVCLDLFAGSGALGFEAASRGAARAVLVERSAPVAAALKANAQSLGAENVVIVREDALKFLSSTDLRCDVVFLDPPYHQGWIERIEPLLSKVLRPEAAIYAESEVPLERIGAWETVRRGKAGQVFYHLLRRSQADAE